MSTISSLEELEKVYGEPVERSLWKEIDHINDHYKAFIEKSPFLILATYGEKGIDCSPRGDPAGFVRVVDDKCIQIPNVGETIRLNGKAEIVVDEELCRSFSINGNPASSVLSITVDKVYYQCQKAIARSKLWDSSSYIDRKELPTAGQMTKVFSALQNREFDAETYDENYPEHMKKTIY